jgi:GT2 family glycosyltransferase
MVAVTGNALAGGELRKAVRGLQISVGTRPVAQERAGGRTRADAALCNDRPMDARRWTAEQRSLREALRTRERRQEGGEEQGERAAPAASEECVLVSVIVVCWNSADVIGRCLRALAEQDYPNYEIVVVDDGSGDETRAVAERELAGGRGTVVASPVNRGCPHARNLGLEHAKGEIVAFVDADGFAAGSWLREVVAAFGEDETIGGVASTVFFADDPLAINGAGGTVNCQGWAADLLMGESYERAEPAEEALYAMGCGMALRRKAIDRVGEFDDRMLNYYDDVDYGVRLWRSGYRVVVAGDAWIDHGFGQAGGGGDAQPGPETPRRTALFNTPSKRLLCERHRMRVVLKHAPLGELGRWAKHELEELRRADGERRGRKLRAIGWNVRHLGSTLAARRALRGAPHAPQRLIDPSWGDGFPTGVPPRARPQPESAGNALEMADQKSEGQLLYGWFAVERAAGRSRRWAGVQAGALIRLDARARRVRFDYAHVPVDGGGVDVSVRRPGAPEPLVPVWGTHLGWRYAERSVESRVVDLEAGDYEVVFSAPRGWTDPPRETRRLGFALESMAFEESWEIAEGGIDMAAEEKEEQLLSGWFEGEQSAERHYRWAGKHTEAIVRVGEGGAGGASMSYRFPPGPTGGLAVSVRAVDAREGEVAWSTRLEWREGEWHEQALDIRLGAGDYVVRFDADKTWSNPEGDDGSLPPENRALGFALSSLVLRGL